jgi:uncharacterized protein YhhL (DUF1145 family)
MAPFINSPSKPLILVTYAAAAALFIAISAFGDDWLSPVLPSPGGQIGRPDIARMIIKFFAISLAIHAGEFAVKHGVMKRDNTKTMTEHFIQTMLFGTFHWKPIENRQGFAWTPLKSSTGQPKHVGKPNKGE